MKKAAAIVLGVLSFLPLLYTLLFAWNDSLATLATLDLENWIAGIYLVLIAAAVLSTLKVVPQGKRGLWAVVLVLANIVALPFFWLWYVRPYLWRSSEDFNAV